MHGYLLVMPRKNAEFNTEKRGNKSRVVFLGDGLEKIEGIQCDFLKNVGKHVPKKESLEVFGEFTYAEIKYIRIKNPGLRIKINIKHGPVDFIRQVKDAVELSNIRKSMQIVGRVFDQVRRKLMNTDKTRINTEKALAQFITKTGYKFGAGDISFPAIVASGANAAIPHHVPSNKKLKAGESIIIDFGFKYKNYCSDFTRTVFLKRVPAKLEKVYNQVEKAYEGAMEFISAPASLGTHTQKKNVKPVGNGLKPFPTACDVYQKAVDVLAEARLDKYFIHSLGHGTGLEIHELPNLSPGSKDVLKDNMVFSIEPGVYIKGLGGVRIEDLVYLKNGGVEKFIKVSTKLKDNII